MSKCDLLKSTLLKSHFGMGVLLQICRIFSEHLFSRTPLGDWFWMLHVIYYFIICAFSVINVSIFSLIILLESRLKNHTSCNLC